MSYRTSLWLIPFVFAACAETEAPAQSPGEEMDVTAAQETAPTDPIEIAMSAGPRAITSEATIMQVGPDGSMTELRAGTNGWMCIPDDNPAAPGNAPMCVDGPWQAFLGGWMSGEPPEIDKLGVSYMMQGGPWASNEDPFATEPPEGQDWVQEPPHLMIVVPDPAMLDGFPTVHTTGGPYVMWAGTPYAHLMVPVN
jgi:hypothetical protein